jgi:hypothetical protein
LPTGLRLIRLAINGVIARLSLRPCNRLWLPSLYFIMHMCVLKAFSLNLSTVYTRFVAILQLSVVDERAVAVRHARHCSGLVSTTATATFGSPTANPASTVASNSLRLGARVGRPEGSSAWPTPSSSTREFLRMPLLTGRGRDLKKCGNSPYVTFDRLWPALDGTEMADATVQWGTSRPSWLAQLTESVGRWTR